MTRQEIYNKVRDHLLKQDRRSTRAGQCAYRGDDGLACAVGCLISDERYDPRMDEPQPLQALWNTAHGRPGFERLSTPSEDTQRLLTALQRVHDSHYPGEWRKRLAQVATAHGLVP